MAIAYHRDQTGAPTVSYSSTANAAAHFNSLKAILKGCLVEGYGSEPAAGWELISEGSSYLVLRNGSQTGYLGLSFATGVVTVHVSETYEGVVSNILQGDGQKSGTASANSVPHRFGAQYVAYASAAATWMVVADERSFSINCATNNNTVPWVPGLNAASQINFLFYAGEDSEGNFIAIGGFNTTATAVMSQQNRFSASGFSALRDPSKGLLVDVSSVSVVTHGLVDTQRISGSQPAAPVVDFARAYWHGGGSWGGFLRGLVMPGLLSVYLPGSIAGALGFSGTYNTRTANTPIDLGDGFNYFVPVYYELSTGLLMTDNPEFW